MIKVFIVRIISGKFKGLKLIKPKNFLIRPTSDKLKGAVFSIINSQKHSLSIKNANFLDLFSGSGSIGIEALSREAGNVFMVDYNKNSINLIKENIKKLNLSSLDIKKVHIIKSTDKNLENIKLPIFDFVYIDPPYSYKNYNKILSVILKKQIISKHTIIFIETGFLYKNFHESYKTISIKKFSNSFLNIIKLTSIEEFF